MLRPRRLKSPRLRKLIPCGYCFEEWADCFDHILPVARGGTNKKSNLYPACKRCNGLLSALLFNSLEQKRDYIRLKLIERGEWHGADQMQRMRESIPEEQKVASVLFRQVPVGKMVKDSSKGGTGRCQWCGQTKYLVDDVYCKKCLNSGG